MRQRWLTIVLAVSVGLNLFFLGISAARWWQHQSWRSEHWGRAASADARGQGGDGGRPEPRRGGSRRGRGGPLSWMTEAERAELRPKREAMVGIRHDAEQVLGAEPFDAAKFQSTLQALRAETAQIQTTVHEKLVQRAATLSPEERRKLVDVSWGTPGERGRTSRQRD
ncbi:MAG: hypothetical protein RL033_4336 [Pseudomonadota bacterium]